MNQREKWIDSMIIPNEVGHLNEDGDPARQIRKQNCECKSRESSLPEQPVYPTPRSFTGEMLESCRVGLNQGQNKQIQSAFRAE